jgi:Ca2+/Na+ antiporter
LGYFPPNSRKKFPLLLPTMILIILIFIIILFFGAWHNKLEVGFFAAVLWMLMALGNYLNVP